MGIESRGHIHQKTSEHYVEDGGALDKSVAVEGELDAETQGIADDELHSFERVLGGQGIQTALAGIEHVEQSKKGLGSFNDKVFQLDSVISIPLGHFRCKL